jgi:hypothetical protein
MTISEVQIEFIKPKNAAEDLHQDCGIDTSCVHRWEREEGLIAIDSKQPALFHCETVRQFLEYKNISRKFPKGKAILLVWCVVSKENHSKMRLLLKRSLQK